MTAAYEWRCPKCGNGTGTMGDDGPDCESGCSEKHTGDGLLEAVPCRDALCRRCGWRGPLPLDRDARLALLKAARDRAAAEVARLDGEIAKEQANG